MNLRENNSKTQPHCGKFPHNFVVTCLLSYFTHWSHPMTWQCRQRGIVESSWNVMAHGDAQEGKWRGNWRMEWIASTLHTNSEHGVSSITTADAHTSAASSQLSWCPRRFKWTRPFRRKTKSGFCACAITFQKHSTNRFTTLVLGGWWWAAPHCFIHIWSMIITLYPCMVLLIHTSLYLHC